jgi:hypothetical protein
MSNSSAAAENREAGTTSKRIAEILGSVMAS